MPETITCGELPRKYDTTADWETAHATLSDAEADTTDTDGDSDGSLR